MRFTSADSEASSTIPRKLKFLFRSELLGHLHLIRIHQSPAHGGQQRPRRARRLVAKHQKRDAREGILRFEHILCPVPLGTRWANVRACLLTAIEIELRRSIDARAKDSSLVSAFRSSQQSKSRCVAPNRHRTKDQQSSRFDTESTPINYYQCWIKLIHFDWFQSFNSMALVFGLLRRTQTHGAFRAWS